MGPARLLELVKHVEVSIALKGITQPFRVVNGVQSQITFLELK